MKTLKRCENSFKTIDNYVIKNALVYERGLVERLIDFKKKREWMEFLVASMIGIIHNVKLNRHERDNLASFTSFLSL